MTAAFMCGQKVLTGIFRKYQPEFKYDVSISLEWLPVFQQIPAEGIELNIVRLI